MELGAVESGICYTHVMIVSILVYVGAAGVIYSSIRLCEAALIKGFV
jgi:hypothetical protein